MPKKVKPVPTNFHTVTPYLTMNDTARALEFYKRAFGAQEVMRMDGPGGTIGHAEIKIGDSIIMLGDEMPGSGTRAPQAAGSTTVAIMLYVDDADEVYNQAVSAGAQVEQPLQDMFWGDRYGRLKDPFGHSWAVATHIEDVAPAEMTKRMQEAMAKRQPQSHSAG
ncbi:MAG TPA: VOC family protein [Candidatus Sulfopaludibacter sp.]|jgi:PhnB protein|nr:VOC family protein [Candidatus Sulfopaludibacter sp.]